MSVRGHDLETARVTCREFRRKTDFYVNEAEGRPDHEACPEYPWCGRTATAVGPDGEPVLRERCRPGRKCFDPVLRDPT